jgi:hypothetical protein
LGDFAGYLTGWCYWIQEQWDDGNNYPAVAPSVILGYDRNAS